jgi:hypothetical protein
MKLMIRKQNLLASLAFAFAATIGASSSPAVDLNGAVTLEEAAVIAKWFGRIPGATFRLRTPTNAASAFLKMCTTSIVKIDGQCVMLTNHHCAPEASVNLVLPEVPGADNRDLRVNVIKRDAMLDIAQLEMPREISQLTCPSLRDHSSDDGRGLEDGHTARVALMSVGNLGGERFLNFSADIRWDTMRSGLSRLSVYRISNQPTDYYYRATDIDIFPGMSGGYVLDQEAKFVGLHAHYIPFQGIAFLIPPRAIAASLNSPVKFRERLSPADFGRGDTWRDNNRRLLSDSSRTHNALRPAGANSHGDPGANSHGDPGANSHGDPGANSHADPQAGSLIARAFLTAQEPLEGVIDPEDPQTVLLGIGTSSVDGYDDFARLSTNGDHRITRPAGDDGYPDLKVRQSLFDRLQGRYQSAAPKDPESWDYLYLSDARSPIGWSRLASGHPAMTVVIDPRAREITFRSTGYSLNGTDGTTHSVPAIHVRMNWQQTVDGKSITLSARNVDAPNDPRYGAELVCKNQNYLKLLCSAGPYFFSLALDDIKRGHLSYRYGAVTTVENRDMFIFRFGELVRAGSW